MLDLINEVEKMVNYSFPEDYKNYILNLSSLKLERNLFKSSNGVEKVLRCLLSYDEDSKNNIMKFQTIDSELNGSIVPFGLLEFGDLLCFDKENNTVVMYDHELDKINMLANDFTGFLDMLY